ncbi:FHA domain-containing protein [Frigoribacterium sp. 2-23]|uniref:FHA domain-containing protein n=1 Tax=Frigoribacterium sp. 2-23 TaxID=3415006 RepID=UPI003C6FC580
MQTNPSNAPAGDGRPPAERPETDVDVDDTIIMRRGTAPSTPGHVSAEPDDLADTVLVERAAAPRPPLADAVEDTVVGGARPRAGLSSRPVPPAVPVVPAAVERVHAVRVGTVVHALEAPLIIGRRPSGPRIISGAVPRLVTVASPTGEVSSTHVDIRHEGASVVVTDLRSTNGTVVAMPGRAPVRLRQGESVVALAGSLVDIGDGNVLEILPPQRITFQEEPHP